ncbi:nuclear transport factor 2 family protein [Mycobacterium sp. CBMA247]|nr:nuclear transport factor 2 family protein [Mycolicibacterium sp. CBMA 329]MUL86549.1 nuclear transport factor 2 family protein [Mycolicibacterium sp. CBMA 331]MUM01410.1 nuclear transport factor 2 family protein [Mycolicibacterium sp. CBMA 334]MUM25919.1 nuclear transport factor 2 family protein [Mycolicibacterium sp. CBMA 295]MUM36845.1 nuclear transport factor 2 family protein [Mycolicibacterium sp. CBMA 247]MUM42613.1 nuclear transport factor 2 family protein [Mycolicibacterium sp. CBMA 
MESRLRDLEQRLQVLTDQVEVTQLIASYGPLVDAGAATDVAALWSEDGSYDVEGWQMRSRADVHAMVSSDAHQTLIARGACHFLGPAQVKLDGDAAEAVCESLLVVQRDGKWIVARAGANHFALHRIDGRWQIVRRTTRALNGSPEARALLMNHPAGEPQ